VTKTETLLPLDPIVFTPTTFRHTKRLPIRISRPSHKKFHFKKKARKTGNSTDPLELVRQKVLVIKDPLKRPFYRKKGTPLR
jgi:hypothetical protein